LTAAATIQFSDYYMTVQSIKIRGQQFVLLRKRDFEKLTERLEDEYWTKVALDAEAESRARGEKPIPLEEVERELQAQWRTRSRGRRSGGRRP
jgi:hypothetical protein